MLNEVVCRRTVTRIPLMLDVKGEVVFYGCDPLTLHHHHILIHALPCTSVNNQCIPFGSKPLGFQNGVLYVMVLGRRPVCLYMDDILVLVIQNLKEEPVQYPFIPKTLLDQGRERFSVSALI